MRALITSLGLVLLSGAIATAQTAQDPSALDAPANAKKAMASKQVSGEIVSVDATAKTVTVTKMSGLTPSTADDDDDSTQTFRVEGKAETSLTKIKTGDKVTLTCRSAAGEECAAVTSISKTP